MLLHIEYFYMVVVAHYRGPDPDDSTLVLKGPFCNKVDFDVDFAGILRLDDIKHGHKKYAI